MRSLRGLAAGVPRPGSDDRGATLALVALSMIVLMGMAALVIDLGHGWQTRRSMIPATDAAALAAAQDFIDDNDGCASTAETYLTNNEANANLDTCHSYNYSADHGRVTVEASHNVETWFAGAIGLGDFTVESVSTAVWAPPLGVTGLRPIGLCIDGNQDLHDLIDHPPTTETVIKIPYEKDQPDACGAEEDIPGNWGFIDFDGGNNSTDDTKDWVENGFPDPIELSDHSVTTCVGEPHCYEGLPGAPTGVHPELNALRLSGQDFTVPLFNYVEDNGANALFHLVGVINVRLSDYKLTGDQATWYFEFIVLPGDLITGTCCNGTGEYTGNKVIILCGVDPGNYAACDP